MSSVYGLPEHLVMPFETLDIVGRFKYESKQIQECRRVPALWVERVEVGSFRVERIAGVPAPFPVKIRTIPAVADRGPDLAPSGLRPQHVNDHPAAVTAGLVAI